MIKNLLIKHMAKTGTDMWQRGWAEANGGNISLRLNSEQRALFELKKPLSEWIESGIKAPELGGDIFAFTGTGRYLRNIELAPERNIGFIELNSDATAYRILWGFEPEGRPTSELSAHLLSHRSIKISTNNYAHAVIHTHTPKLIALTYIFDNLDTALLSTMLWRMHAECVVVFPEGVEFIPWIMAGSRELGEKTAISLLKRSLVVWEHHGVIGTGRNLDEAFGRIYVAEKAAEILLTCLSVGGIRKFLSNEQLEKIASNFKCNWDKSLIVEWPE
ncbi:MAG TPA: rhamnulose-1-phosphate aldolase [Victivallales bacterium]|nr:rhamnulose-1-phosphate aldolase [Victivallales bacterium]HRU00287.1 rhamnulose-1-phosphate aldolase [Victivallales bacterium]